MSEVELSEQGEALSRIIFSMHDKPERVKALYAARDRAPIADIASIFGDVWTNSESLFDNQDELAALIHMIREAGVADHAMSKIECTRLRALKGKGSITLYRGAAENNISGYSWTTKRETALFFAKRNALDGKPLLVKATFTASDLVFCFNGRNEFEVVVDMVSPSAQAALAAAKVTKLPSQQVTASHMLMAKIQAYGNNALFGGEEAERARLQMAVVSQKISGRTLEQITGSLQRDVDRLESFGFTAKAAEIRKQIEAITELYTDPETEKMVGHFKANA